MNELSNAPCVSELRELGFTAITDQITQEQSMAAKMRIAFEHFRVVKPDHVARFNTDLKTKTQSGYTYDTLVFTKVSDFTKGSPPKEVLDKMRDAKQLGCFDDFEIATIESVTVIPDPILFGIIEGCANKYYVAQWDNDVCIEDILSDDEG